jgi:DNA-binding CsgD family transcriptional regulator
MNASAWRQELADALEQALRPDAVGVFTCVLGNVLDAAVAMAPKAFQSIGERLVEDFLPRALRDGALSPWSVLGPRPGVDDDDEIVALVREQLLVPVGFHGTITRFMRADTGAVFGWITVFSRRPADECAPEVEQGLSQVCHSAGQTIRRSLSLAASAGARAPELSLVMLSPREREVARLAGGGLSDLNIARQLTISEGTVGRHLQSIFRKLGVSSRAELHRLIGTRT